MNGLSGIRKSSLQFAHGSVTAPEKLNNALGKDQALWTVLADPGLPAVFIERLRESSKLGHVSNVFEGHDALPLKHLGVEAQQPANRMADLSEDARLSFDAERR
jgi:hypothetical protein